MGDKKRIMFASVFLILLAIFAFGYGVNFGEKDSGLAKRSLAFFSAGQPTTAFNTPISESTQKRPEVIGTGTFFKLEDSDLPIAVSSSELISIYLRSSPKMVDYYISPVKTSKGKAVTTQTITVPKTNIAISGLKPNTTHYMYEDSYHNLTKIESDSEGSYSYLQDLSSSHYVWIQETDSNTYFIIDNSTGGDCEGKEIGNWNMVTKTCTLTKDVNEGMQIVSNAITLDCVGYGIIGAGTIHLYDVNSITVKNCVGGMLRLWKANKNTISNSKASQVLLFESNENSLSYNEAPIHLLDSSYNNLNNNAANSSSDYGIHVSLSNNNTLTNNTANLNNNDGIVLSWSNDSTLNGNTANSNGGDGIFIFGSNNTNLNNNNASQNNGQGIRLSLAKNSKLRNNTLTNNGFNFGIDDWELDYLIQDIDPSNTVNGKPVYYWVNKINAQIPSDAGYVAVIGSSNITIKNLTLTKNGQGVLLGFTTNSTIENVDAANNENGIRLIEANNNIVKNSTAASNKVAIALDYSNNNILTNNEIHSNLSGIESYVSSENEFNGNRIYSNNENGIRLRMDSSNNTINGNNIYSNKYGISLIEDEWPVSNHNILVNNRISSNEYGLSLLFANDNTIYHNNIINNTTQLENYESSNAWNNDQNEGNYWSDYTGTDSDGDGIGDTLLPHQGVDYYPFMEEDGWLALPDLFIEWIKPIQVVEDVDLVAEKATVVRVKVVNTSGQEIETGVKLDVGTCPSMHQTVTVTDSKIVDFYPPNDCIR